MKVMVLRVEFELSHGSSWDARDLGDHRSKSLPASSNSTGTHRMSLFRIRPRCVSTFTLILTLDNLFPLFVRRLGMPSGGTQNFPWNSTATRKSTTGI